MPVEDIRTVGFLGAGLMGSPMARHLLRAGFRVRV
jgi:3-hydroxyisobutyrate dehydrogenase-like beta-hydroxyacid dehydrogenase